MIAKNEYGALQARLQAILSETFQDVQVQIVDDVHYRGTNFVVTTKDFHGLLPEQRFHHLVRALPDTVYDDYLRNGVVWFELAPGEIPAEYMKRPRSEDIVEQIEAISKRLTSVQFFQKLKDRLLKDPPAASTRDFAVCREILRKSGLSQDEIAAACLYFIRHGGYCDAQVVVDVVNELAGSHKEETVNSPASALERKAPSRTKPSPTQPRIAQEHI